MEYLPGETLAARMDGGRLSVAEATRIAIEVASGLECVHRASLVHRDIKPANIMLTPTGARILDFGIALSDVAEEGADSVGKITSEGMIVGSVSYMSPEHARGDRTDARSDIFSFGCVLYEMLTGTRAFKRHSEHATLAAILESEPPDVHQIAPDTPDALVAIVKRCLAKSADARYGDASGLLNALRALDAVRTNNMTDAARPAGRWAGRHWSWTTAVLAVIATVVLGTLIVAIRQRSVRAPGMAGTMSIASSSFTRRGCNGIGVHDDRFLSSFESRAISSSGSAGQYMTGEGAIDPANPNTLEGTAQETVPVEGGTVTTIMKWHLTRACGDSSPSSAVSIR